MDSKRRPSAAELCQSLSTEEMNKLVEEELRSYERKALEHVLAPNGRGVLANTAITRTRSPHEPSDSGDGCSSDDGVTVRLRRSSSSMPPFRALHERITLVLPSGSGAAAAHAVGVVAGLAVGGRLRCVQKIMAQHRSLLVAYAACCKWHALLQCAGDSSRVRSEWTEPALQWLKALCVMPMDQWVRYSFRHPDSMLRRATEWCFNIGTKGLPRLHALIASDACDDSTVRVVEMPDAKNREQRVIARLEMALFGWTHDEDYHGPYMGAVYPSVVDLLIEMLPVLVESGARKSRAEDVLTQVWIPHAIPESLWAIFDRVRRSLYVIGGPVQMVVVPFYPSSGSSKAALQECNGEVVDLSHPEEFASWCARGIRDTTERVSMLSDRPLPGWVYRQVLTCMGPSRSSSWPRPADDRIVQRIAASLRSHDADVFDDSGRGKMLLTAMSRWSCNSRSVTTAEELFRAREEHIAGVGAFGGEFAEARHPRGSAAAAAAAESSTVTPCAHIQTFCSALFGKQQTKKKKKKPVDTMQNRAADDTDAKKGRVAPAASPRDSDGEDLSDIDDSDVSVSRMHFDGFSLALDEARGFSLPDSMRARGDVEDIRAVTPRRIPTVLQQRLAPDCAGQLVVDFVASEDTD